MVSPTTQPLTTRSPSFEERLDASPITSTMRSLWALSAGLIALDGFDFFIIGLALPLLQRDFGLSPREMGLVAVAAVAGSLLGSLTLGPLTDRLGRQRMLVADIGLFIVATAGSALAWDAWSLIGWRFLVGMAIGADYPISVAYITENVPSRSRGQMVIGAFTFQAIGALLGALTGLTVLYGFQALAPDQPHWVIEYGWRWMLGVGLVLAIAVGLGRWRFTLESPLYYLAQGDYAAASEAATTLLETPVALTPETDPPDRAPQLPYHSLFSTPFRRSLLLASLPWFLQDIATYGIGIFTPVIIAALAFAHNTDWLARDMAAATGSAIVDVFLIVGFGIAVVLIERVGRIRLQVMGFLGMAIGLLILAASNQLMLPNDWRLPLVFLGFFVFNLAMNAGPNSTTFLLSGEVFPTAIRASGAGFAAAIAKAGAILGTVALPLLQTTWGVSNLLLGLALCCGLAAVLTYCLRIETTGRSLQPDQD